MTCYSPGCTVSTTMRLRSKGRTVALRRNQLICHSRDRPPLSSPPRHFVNFSTFLTVGRSSSLLFLGLCPAYNLQTSGHFPCFRGIRATFSGSESQLALAHYPRLDTQDTNVQAYDQSRRLVLTTDLRSWPRMEMGGIRRILGMLRLYARAARVI